MASDILIFCVYVAMFFASACGLKWLVCKMLGVTTYYPLSTLMNWTIIAISLVLPIVVATGLDAILRYFLGH